MTLEEYLKKHHRPQTVKVYLFEIGHYLHWAGEQRARDADTQTVLDYLAHLRSRYDKGTTIRRILYAIKRYYAYLQHAGIRTDHPCRLLSIRDGRNAPIQTQDLPDMATLEKLLERKERYESYALRNRLILSLLIYQALLTGELCGLKVQDIDLERGQVYIRQTSRTDARTLPLQAKQVILIQRYLTEYRPHYVKEATDALIITGRGRAERGEGVHYLVSTMRKASGCERLTPMVIRQAVIAQKLKSGQDLRQVQAFAGHRMASSTEAYRNTDLSELVSAVQKYHPWK